MNLKAGRIDNIALFARQYKTVSYFRPIFIVFQSILEADAGSSA